MAVYIPLSNGSGRFGTIWRTYNMDADAYNAYFFSNAGTFDYVPTGNMHREYHEPHGPVVNIDATGCMKYTVPDYYAKKTHTHIFHLKPKRDCVCCCALCSAAPQG